MAAKVGPWGVDPEYLFSPLATMERPRVSRGDTRMPEQSEGIGAARPTQHDYATAYAPTIDVATRYLMIPIRDISRRISHFLFFFLPKVSILEDPFQEEIPFFGPFLKFDDAYCVLYHIDFLDESSNFIIGIVRDRKITKNNEI